MENIVEMGSSNEVQIFINYVYVRVNRQKIISLQVKQYNVIICKPIPHKKVRALRRDPDELRKILYTEKMDW